jgi:signal peptidase I
MVWVRRLARLCVLALLLALLYYLVFGLQLLRVSGNSMAPTLEHGSWVLVDTLQLHWRKPQVGDIVIVRSQEHRLLVKRIAFTPSSTLLWVEDSLYLPESDLYLRLSPQVVQNLEHRSLLGKDELFILGDNRPISYDSRMYGTISPKQIVGRVISRSVPIP